MRGRIRAPKAPPLPRLGAALRKYGRSKAHSIHQPEAAPEDYSVPQNPPRPEMVQLEGPIREAPVSDIELRPYRAGSIAGPGEPRALPWAVEFPPRWGAHTVR